MRDFLSMSMAVTQPTKVYLTPDEKEYLDRSGLATKWCKEHFVKDDFAPVSPFYSKDPDYLLNAYYHNLEHFDVPGHQPYVNYVREMTTKCGRQGGSVTWSRLEPILMKYYSSMNVPVHISKWLYAARDYFIALLKDLIAKFGYPQFAASNPKNTQASLPTFFHKGEYLAEVHGFSISWRHMLPIVPGMRFMRNKLRAIFMDPNPNFKYCDKALSAVREWLKAHFPQLFDAWRAPSISMNARLTRAVDLHWPTLESDFESMDINFHKEIWTELLAPIYEVLLPGAFLPFAAAMEEYFYLPLYCGDYIIIGEHSLFSGINPTNDFETLYRILLEIATAFSMGISYDDIDSDNEGDDGRMSFINGTIEQALTAKDIMADISGNAGMRLSLDKTRVTEGDIRFLRKVYYPKGVRDPLGTLYGAYPGNLVVNNLVQPERPNFREDLACISDLQRLDNLVGSPDYSVTLQMFKKYSTYKIFSFTESAVDWVNARDWWFSLYGERWSPDNSPTLQKLRELKLV